MRLLLLTLALATLAACSPAPSPEHAPPTRLALDGLVIESSTELDVTDPNARITAAAVAGATWPGSPLEIAVKVLHGDLDTRELTLHEVKNRTEGADQAVIEAAADGYLDDSVRGAWHRLTLHRQADGTWRLTTHEIAYRCRRGHHLDAYSAELCPLNPESPHRRERHQHVPCADGRIAREWAQTDSLGMLRQMGVLPG